MAAVDMTQGDINEYGNEYDNDVDNFRKDLALDAPEQTSHMSYVHEPTTNMDEEIKITKKRKPIAKLDVERLLSERGIPELRRRAVKRIKLRGKGNEFEDISNLLQMYQMWLDDMYPKAKFRDGLKMIEKLGHSKRMNVTRKAWITATRPGRRDEEADDDRQAFHDSDHDQRQDSNEDEPGRRKDTGSNQDDANQSLELDEDAERTTAGSQRTTQNHPEEDELDALLGQELEEVDTVNRSGAGRTTRLFEEDSDEDDLDALLNAETGTKASIEHQVSTNKDGTASEHDFADEEAAMHDMGI